MSLSLFFVLNRLANIICLSTIGFELRYVGCHKKQ